jgi:hypothetical protein
VVRAAEATGQELAGTRIVTDVRLAQPGMMTLSTSASCGCLVPKWLKSALSSEIPERLVTMIKDQVPQLSAHANEPPRDKLPAKAQPMRTWSTRR